VEGIDDAVSILMSSARALSSICVLRRSGDLWCWGDFPGTQAPLDPSGVSFDGGPSHPEGILHVGQPARLTSIDRIVDFQAYNCPGFCGCAVRDDGTLWCFDSSGEWFPRTPTRIFWDAGRLPADAGTAIDAESGVGGEMDAAAAFDSEAGP